MLAQTHEKGASNALLHGTEQDTDKEPQSARDRRDGATLHVCDGVEIILYLRKNGHDRGHGGSLRAGVELVLTVITVRWFGASVALARV